MNRLVKKKVINAITLWFCKEIFAAFPNGIPNMDPGYPVPN